MPEVSVIIPAYNAARYLDDAIQSILSQSYRNYEIILVDDGSIDDTLRVARRYRDSMKIVSQPNAGPSTARNAGIKHSEGKYLAFLDADDLFLPVKLEIQVKYLEKYPEVDVVYSTGYCFWGDSNALQTRRSFQQQGLLDSNLGAPEESLPVLAVQNGFPIHAALVRRDAVIAVGGFDEKLFGREDWDLWLRVAETHHFAYLEKEVALYRQVGSGVTAQHQHQVQAVRIIGQKVESREWFRCSPPRVRSNFYLSWGVQELEYRQTQAALQHLRQALEVDSHSYRARIALMCARCLGSRAANLYHLQRRLLGPVAPRSRRTNPVPAA